MFVYYLNSQLYVSQITFYILEKCVEKYLWEVRKSIGGGWQKKRGNTSAFQIYSFLLRVTKRLPPSAPRVLRNT